MVKLASAEKIRGTDEYRRMVTEMVANEQDVRGLDFFSDGFHIIFYRQVSEKFLAELLLRGVSVIEREIWDDERRAQYIYYYER